MRTKGLRTTISSTGGVSYSGLGDMKRISVVSTVHVGPAGTVDRTCNLVLDSTEARRLAISLLGALSPDELLPSLEKLQKLVALTLVAKEVDSASTKG